MSLLLSIRAAVRIVLLLLVIGIGALFVLLLSLLPIRVGGARLATWPVTIMARLFMRFAGIAYHCPALDVVRQPRGKEIALAYVRKKLSQMGFYRLDCQPAAT